ncbi:MAG: hypothetical protein JXM70_18875 [Pirellulales bacterium]|nr:hypothetical protein [Pirellulales bacterium]
MIPKRKPTLDYSIAGITNRLRSRTRQPRRSRADQYVGRDIDTGKRSYFKWPGQGYHTLIFGATRRGKSYFLEMLICYWLYLRQVCPDRCPGFALIDPHTLTDRVLERLVQFGVDPSDVILIDLADESCLPAFQPFARHGAAIEFQVGAFKLACIKAWGKDDFDRTPLLARWLSNSVLPLIEANLSPAELEWMLSLDDFEPLRLAILKQCTNSAVCRAWTKEFPGYRSVNQKMDQIGSSVNRLEPYYQQPFLRRLFGRVSQVIDWRSVMDSGKIVILRSSGGNILHSTETNLISTLLLNEFVRGALRPPSREKERNFFVVVDELQKSLCTDHLNLMRETAKYRTIFIAATQNPSALQAHDEELYLSALSNCLSKVIFGGLTCEEIEKLARDAFAPVVDPDLVKYDLERTYFEPRESTRTVPSHTDAHSEMAAHSDMAAEGTFDSWSKVTHGSSSTGTSIPIDGMFLPTNYGAGTMSEGSVSGHVTGQSGAHSNTRGHSDTHASSDTVADGYSVVPFYELIKRRELSSRQFRDLREQNEMAINRLHCLPPQQALLTVTGEPPAIVQISNLPNANVSSQTIHEYRKRIMANPYYATPEQIDREIEQRKQDLLASLGPSFGAFLKLQQKQPARSAVTARAANNRRMVHTKQTTLQDTVSGNNNLHVPVTSAYYAREPIPPAIAMHPEITPTTSGNSEASTATDPVGLLAVEHDNLVWSDETALRQFLGKLRQLAPAERRPFLVRLAMDSHKPMSYFNRIMRSLNGK